MAQLPVKTKADRGRGRPSTTQTQPQQLGPSPPRDQSKRMNTEHNEFNIQGNVQNAGKQEIHGGQSQINNHGTNDGPASVAIINSVFEKAIAEAEAISQADTVNTLIDDHDEFGADAFDDAGDPAEVLLAAQNQFNADMGGGELPPEEFEAEKQGWFERLKGQGPLLVKCGLVAGEAALQCLVTKSPIVAASLAICQLMKDGE